ncbi:MAG: DUF2283 domain-containing protein [Patescibacteria group bacterium]
MKISYDQKADALYIKLREGAFVENKEVSEGMILDLGEENTILGIEILSARDRLTIEGLSHIDIQVPVGVPALV